MTHTAGFACLVGRPNVGKSSLTNALVGEKVAITSPRPQTTRHAVRGIVNMDQAQLILVDTPGLHKPRTLLGGVSTTSYERPGRKSTSSGYVCPPISDQARGPLPGDRDCQVAGRSGGADRHQDGSGGSRRRGRSVGCGQHHVTRWGWYPTMWFRCRLSPGRTSTCSPRSSRQRYRRGRRCTRKGCSPTRPEETLVAELIREAALAGSTRGVAPLHRRDRGRDESPAGST